MTQTRRENLRQRLTTTKPDGRKRCWVFDCPDRPGNASGNGLGRFCRKHLEHLRRHGDALKRSYEAPRVSPYRRSAASWLKKNPTDRHVVQTLKRIDGLMLKAGASIPPRNLRGVPVAGKARAVWARLRERERRPDQVTAVILGVAMCYYADPQKGKLEYLQVQIAKVLNRMAGGEVRRWPTNHSDPTLPKERVLRWFPASEGLVLRQLGKEALTAVGYLVDGRMDELLTFHRQRLESK